MRSPGRVGLVAACDDGDLLNFRLWPRQRELLAAVEEGGPRLHVWAFGRRAGKTSLAALVALWDCLLRPQLDELVRPGERRYAVAVATNLRQARLYIAAARSVVERSPVLADYLEASTDDELRFANGTALSAFPCTSRGARGWPISSVLLDEAAHHVDNEGNAAAEPIFRALVPSLAQFGGRGRAIVSSTPYGSEGFFARLWHSASEGELEGAVAQHATTAEANPTIPPAFLEQEQARDPESFRSEYLAEFVGGGGAYLDPETIAAAVVDRGELAPGQATHWIAGLDPAFSSDPFGLAIVGLDVGPPDRSGLDPLRLRLGLARSWKPTRRASASFAERRAVEDAVLREVADVCRAYRARVVTDQHLARAVVDYLRQRGLAVRVESMSATSKTHAFGELRARLRENRLELYEQPDLLAELRRLRTRYSAGAASVVNPRVAGSHGDVAQALALAVAEFSRLGLGVANAFGPSDESTERIDPLALRREVQRARGAGTDRDGLAYDMTL